MKLSFILRQQHAGELFVKHWKVQGKRILIDSGAIRELKQRGIPVADAAQFIYSDKQKKLQATPLSRLEPKILQSDECLLYTDCNVLLGGLDQAKVLTNTVEPCPGQLPDIVGTRTPKLPDNIDELVLKCLKSSLIFETEQKKLPKKYDAERPAWNFPRDYGITDRRKNKVLSLRLLDLCSKLSRPLPVVEEASFAVSLKRQTLAVSLSLRSDHLVLSDRRLQPIDPDAAAQDGTLPDIHPLLPTISLEVAPTPADKHPLTMHCKFRNIQLAVSHYNETEVANLYKTPVSHHQLLGRSLMKSFTFAVAQARYMFGDDVVDLPEPLIFPSLQTDSRRFHFSIFQLNTIEEHSKNHNYLWSLPVTDLYTECGYSDGVPTVKNLNPDVFKTLFMMYNL